ncbi:MAG TPA: DNA translocase FtsK 4TM domain-containing protein, partial [Terriglobales bacterium]|nr:DNA translocase FtsK 4TM domain-containing protein [Terriglobales bacterium]
MRYFSQIFAPTNNRRLNELIGFLLCVSGLLLFLALASYSPLDPSFNSASVLTGSGAARNWVGLVGAIVSDLLLQGFGVGAFLLPVFFGALGTRWFRSRRVMSPFAKSLGAFWLLMFVPALLALLPGHARWLGVIPMEGLLGRIVGDALIHYLNLAGAYIVCAAILAVALYLSTAFSFAALQVWAPTRFAFVVALWNRYQDWQDNRARKKMQKELEKRRAARPTVTAQLIPARSAPPSTPLHAPEPVRATGIDRMTVASRGEAHPLEPQPQQTFPEAMVPDVEVTERADTGAKP